MKYRSLIVTPGLESIIIITCIVRRRLILYSLLCRQAISGLFALCCRRFDCPIRKYPYWQWILLRWTLNLWKILVSNYRFHSYSLRCPYRDCVIGMARRCAAVHYCFEGCKPNATCRTLKTIILFLYVIYVMICDRRADRSLAYIYNCWLSRIGQLLSLYYVCGQLIC